MSIFKTKKKTFWQSHPKWSALANLFILFTVSWFIIDWIRNAYCRHEEYRLLKQLQKSGVQFGREIQDGDGTIIREIVML